MSDNIKRIREVSKEEIKNELRAAKAEEKKNQEEKIKKSKFRMHMVLLFLLFTIIIGYIVFRGEYLEIIEIGEQYSSIFWQNLSSIAITFGINFIILFFIIYMNNHRMKKNLKVFFDEDKKVLPRLPNKSLAFIISIIVSSITSKIILNTYLLCMNSTAFGVVDPIFGLDIGYFMFQKPFVEFMIIYALLLVVGLTIYNIIYYISYENFE